MVSLFLLQENSYETCVMCKKVITLVLAISVPLSELDVLLSVSVYIHCFRQNLGGRKRKLKVKDVEKGQRKNVENLI